MKLPLNFLLYTVSVGLLGAAGYLFYQMYPQLSQAARSAQSKQGGDDGSERLKRGKSQGPQAGVNWQYTEATKGWWEQFRQVNIVGKLPEELVAKPTVEDAPPPPPPLDQRPLDQIFELVTLFYDPKEGGRAGDTHVIVRYKPDANVVPPDWWLRENSAPGAAGPVAMPQDVAPGARGGGRGGRGGARPAMPVSQATGEKLQRVFVSSNDEPRRETRLWPPYSHIRLVRVAPDAQSAFFVRAKPEGQAAQPDETAPAEPKEEELQKAFMSLSQDLLQTIRSLPGTSVRSPVERGAEPTATAPGGEWIDVGPLTKEVSGVRYIGEEDQRMFRERPDELLDRIQVDTYISKQSNTRGLMVLRVDPQVARFGVQQGDVLLEVNGRPVSSRAEALNFGRKEYDRGVRTFTTKWLSVGQIVERTYQAPNK